MKSLCAHLLASDDEHGRYRFRVDCPRCVQERADGPVPTLPLVTGPTRAMLLLAAMGLPSVLPAAALAADSGRHTVPAQAPAPDEADEPGEQDVDPGLLDVLRDEGAGNDDQAEDDLDDMGEPDGPVTAPAPDVEPTAPDPLPAPDQLASPADPEPAVPEAPAEQPPPAPPTVAPPPVGAPPATAPLDQAGAEKTSAKRHHSRADRRPRRPNPTHVEPVTPAVAAAPPSAQPTLATDASTVVVPASDTQSPSRQSSVSSGDPCGRPGVSGPGASDDEYEVRAGNDRRPADDLWFIACRNLGGRPTPAAISAEVDRLFANNREEIASGDPDVIYPGAVLDLR